jgi:hypothetical protein
MPPFPYSALECRSEIIVAALPLIDTHIPLFTRRLFTPELQVELRSRREEELNEGDFDPVDAELDENVLDTVKELAANLEALRREGCLQRKGLVREEWEEGEERGKERTALISHPFSHL